MPSPNSQPQKVWYRQFWPWFLLSVPIASIILSSIMVYVAVKGGDTIVVDNYYKEGRAINQSLEKDQFAEELGIGALFQISQISETNQVVVKIEARQQIAPDYLVLKFYHPTLAGRDMQITLEPTGDLEFAGEVKGDLNGRWYLDILDDQDLWRLKGQTWLPREEPLKLGSLSP